MMMMMVMMSPILPSSSQHPHVQLALSGSHTLAAIRSQLLHAAAVLPLLQHLFGSLSLPRVVAARVVQLLRSGPVRQLAESLPLPRVRAARVLQRLRSELLPLLPSSDCQRVLCMLPEPRVPAARVLQLPLRELMS